MPYISEEQRKELATDMPMNPGELNYLITKLLDGYIKFVGKNYHSLNDCIGVLECTKLEMYRRIVSPYEDKKLLENGEVYTCTEKRE